MTGTFTWRMLATVLGGESLVIFFGALLARGMPGGDGVSSSADRWFVPMGVLAAVTLVTAGLVRRRWGALLGLVLQVLVLASALVVPHMALVGAVFGGLYLGCIYKGRQVDASMAARSADAGDGTTRG